MSKYDLAAMQLFGEGAEWAISDGELIAAPREVSPEEWAAAVAAAEQRIAHTAAMDAARAAAAELWKILPVATRAKFGQLYTAIVDAFNRDDAPAAIYMLQAASVDADEVALKSQFLNLFGL